MFETIIDKLNETLTAVGIAAGGIAALCETLNRRNKKRKKKDKK